MNISVSYNWLLEYLDTNASPYDLAKYLSLSGPSVEKVTKKNNDYVLEIEITSNRIDMVSIIGIAREAAAILPRYGFKAIFKKFSFPKPIANNKKNLLNVTDKEKLCNRLLAVVMENIKIGDSPTHIKERLEAAGIRSLNSLIDITNYVMLEVGHPAHVFDYDRVKSGSLNVRLAKNGEKLITLDNKEYKLTDKDIVIDDGLGRVIDLPGIMGTANSVVTNETKRIIFFIESNDPVAIRRTSMNLGIRTMAATINEKHPDPETASQAFDRGIELFEKLCSGKITSEIIDIYPKHDKSTLISTNADFINAHIGISLKEDEIINILRSLKFEITKEAKKLLITPPYFRQYDVAIEEDIVEEVARIYGYQNLPNNLPPPVYYSAPGDLEKLFLMISKIKRFLKHLGLHETLNYSMISIEQIKNLDGKPEEFLKLNNSISEEIEYLRRSLTPSLIKNLKDNQGKENVLKFFELAKVYHKQEKNLPNEIYKLGIGINTDFFDLKGIIEALLSELNIKNYEIVVSKEKIFSSNIQAFLKINGKQAGIFGLLKQEYASKIGLKENTVLAELDLQALIDSSRNIPEYKHISSFAVVKLDLNVEISASLNYETIKKTALKTSELLENVELIDQFKNRITLRFYFTSSDRNITEEEAIRELDKIKKLI